MLKFFLFLILITLVIGPYPGFALTPVTTLSSATVNSIVLDTSDPVVVVQPGELLSGSITTLNQDPCGFCIIPVVGVNSWDTGYFADLGNLVGGGPPQSVTFNFNFNAPGTPGTYYIVVFHRECFTAADNVYGCWPSGDPRRGVPGGGDDIWDFNYFSSWESLLPGGTFGPGKAIKIVVTPATTDTDEDGISNIDETTIYHSDPFHKDIFLEIDWMEGISEPSHKPNNNVILKLVEAFARAPVSNPDGTTGIRLHVDVSNNVGVFTFTKDHRWDSFRSLKEINFNHEGLQYHYAISIVPVLGLPSVLGESDSTPGDDFWVVLVDELDDFKFSDTSHAGIIMHELGHNLGLQHGGGDDIWLKPNYLSVMNHLFTTGMISRTSPGSFIDYSRQELDPLFLNNLDEKKGIGDGKIQTQWRCPNKIDWKPGFGDQRLDWNCNDVRSDIVTDGSYLNFDRNPNTNVFEGYDDWKHIQFWGSGGGYDKFFIPEINAADDEPSVDLLKEIMVEDSPLVGGEVIPINKTALLLAGLPSTPWLIPILLSSAGVGIFVISRKSK